MNMRLRLPIVHWPGKQLILPGTLLAMGIMFLQLQVEESAESPSRCCLRRFWFNLL